MKKTDQFTTMKVMVSVLFITILMPLFSLAGNRTESHLCVNVQSDRKMINLVTSQNNWQVIVDENRNGKAEYFACAPISEFNQSNISTQELVQVLNILQNSKTCETIISNVLLLKQYLKSSTPGNAINRFSSASAQQNLSNQLRAYELALKLSRCDQRKSI